MNLLKIALAALLVIGSTSASAMPPRDWDNESSFNGQVPAGQRDLIQAQERGRGLSYVEVRDVEVVKLLPDDNRGSRHQSWVVRLANGRTVKGVYNTSICRPVPLRVGSRISMGGQYIFERGGGLIHWLHEDPRGRRPHGWVEVDGQRYGKVERNDGRQD